MMRWGIVVLLSVVFAGVVPAQSQEKAAGKRLPSARWARPRKIDVKHVVLDLRFDWAKRQAYGTAAITFAPPQISDLAPSAGFAARCGPALDSLDHAGRGRRAAGVRLRWRRGRRQPGDRARSRPRGRRGPDRQNRVPDDLGQSHRSEQPQRQQRQGTAIFGAHRKRSPQAARDLVDGRARIQSILVSRL